MRIGIVCPYSFDVPGGVQFHIRDLAERLRLEGHDVSVLAPAEEGTEVPDYLTSVGSAVPVKYNGSVARLAYGPMVSRRTQRWLSAGDFDVVHIHEPFAPSCSLIALRHSSAPVVATFHSAQEQSRALLLAAPFMRPGLERIAARIAVSEEARRTVVEHLGGDAVVIPNGVYVDRMRAAPDPRWQGTPDAPTIAFLGRLDEPRKGLQVLLDAVGGIRAHYPGARLLIAGPGDLPAAWAGDPGVTRLGPISDADKAALLSSVDVYVAPQTGGESFGIVLVEAMSAGSHVVASGLAAFRAVLDDGAAGDLFRVGDPADLARAVVESLDEPDRTAAKRAYARSAADRFDWSTVAARILDVYEIVQGGAGAQRRRGLFGRLIGGTG
ncbi:glycosyltransferase family 4 protein [Pseudactinotalea sp. HY158]|uniref:glycosyltransferase family 4 protein n=1 Tax=Pseudactinotalea sp. HY158 TaxID=2654547 RepID=UPI00129C1AAE|nr:glycosyltransferase family 4 protein [Pseudactinotalea sp. HY158]QGH69332.1 glycosyltransferase [Pseudactinotalea sp. HY158]